MGNEMNGSCQCFRRRKFKSILSFISAVLIPILLGVFTITLALQQDSIARANREVDLRIATEQHQQNHELAIDEQRNAQLVAYIREVSDLLVANNFTLDRRMLSSVIRPKTLATLRQLDVTRKVYLVRFLYESRSINSLNPPLLSLRDADLNSIRIGSLQQTNDMRHLSLVDAQLMNSTFTLVSFGYSDFSSANLRGASFLHASLDYAKFQTAQLQEAHFNDIGSLYKADFTKANMRGARINQQKLESAGSVSGPILPDGSTGRNRNLFINDSCQELIDEESIQKNISVKYYREWMAEIGRNDSITYIFTGWFNKTDQLQVNFTEFDRSGMVLQKYCFGPKESVAQLNRTQQCFTSSWTLPANNTNQDTYVDQRMQGHDKTYTINVDIVSGENGACRDIYFSVETMS